MQAYLDAMPGWKGEIGRRLDALIVEELPHALQAVRWNSPFYGIAGKGWFCNMHCMTKYVKVAWLNGGELDPPPPETSKQPNVPLLEHPRERRERRRPTPRLDSSGSVDPRRRDVLRKSEIDRQATTDSADLPDAPPAPESGG